MPSFALTDEESAKLAEATIRVTQLYDLGIGTDEQRAWINLALVAGSIYIPKVFAGKQEPMRVVSSRPIPEQRKDVEVPSWMNGQQPN
jgi:hypothetical protein